MAQFPPSTHEIRYYLHDESDVIASTAISLKLFVILKKVRIFSDIAVSHNNNEIFVSENF